MWNYLGEGPGMSGNRETKISWERIRIEVLYMYI
jgi:hypothetical protein